MENTEKNIHKMIYTLHDIKLNTLNTAIRIDDDLKIGFKILNEIENICKPEEIKELKLTITNYKTYFLNIINQKLYNIISIVVPPLVKFKINDIMYYFSKEYSFDSFKQIPYSFSFNNNMYNNNCITMYNSKDKYNYEFIAKEENEEFIKFLKFLLFTGGEKQHNYHNYFKNNSKLLKSCKYYSYNQDEKNII